MRQEDFEAQRAVLGCRHCGQVGHLRLAENPNNGGLAVVCSCQRFDPLGGTPYVSRGRPRTRRPLTRAGESLEETWAQWGGRCAACGTDAETLARLGIGRHRDHEPPLASVPDERDTTLVAMCVPCHDLHTANQRVIQQLIARLAAEKAVPPLTDLERGELERDA